MASFMICVFLISFIALSSQKAVNNFAEDYILRSNNEESQLQPDLFDNGYYQSNQEHEDDHKSRENKNPKHYYTIDKLDANLRNDDNEAEDKILRFEDLSNGNIRIYPIFGNPAFGIKEDSDLKVNLNYFDLKFPLEYNEVSSEKPITVADLSKFINSIQKHTSGLFKDFVKTNKTLKEMVSLVQALPPEVQKQLNYKTAYQTAKSNFGKVKNTFGKIDLSILYGPKGPINLKQYDDEKGSDILVPKSLYDSIIASRDSENTFIPQNSKGPLMRKRLLPLTKKQREKLSSNGEAASENKETNRYKTWWPESHRGQNRPSRRNQRTAETTHRNLEHNNVEHGFKFEMEVDGLGQINV